MALSKVLIDPVLHARIATEAEAQRRTIRAVVEMVLEQYLANLQEQREWA